MIRTRHLSSTSPSSFSLSPLGSDPVRATLLCWLSTTRPLHLRMILQGQRSIVVDVVGPPFPSPRLVGLDVVPFLKILLTFLSTQPSFCVLCPMDVRICKTGKLICGNPKPWQHPCAVKVNGGEKELPRQSQHREPCLSHSPLFPCSSSSLGMSNNTWRLQ